MPTENVIPVTTLVLPRLEVGPIKHALGEIRHVIDSGGARDVTKFEDYRTSPKAVEKAYTLDDGQKIVITTKSKLALPDDVDGVLHRDAEGKHKWIAHKVLTARQPRISELGSESFANEVAKSWAGKFDFRVETKDADGQIVRSGLRPPQVGGLHSIGAHWSLSQKPATVVMPTGTGKTETMLATLLAYQPGTMMVVVPSKILREQTAAKFMTLGLLRSLGNLRHDTVNPVVGILRKRPRTLADLDIFKQCNVVVTTMAAVADKSASLWASSIAELVDTLVVDEAHHVAAASWSSFRERFKHKGILQFTATPYRRDGKLVDGKVIYEYPLHVAQKDGYFKKINFEPVYEIDQDDADKAIAEKALAVLTKDIEAGHDHLIMARCVSVERARAIHALYMEIASEHNPVLVHSEESGSELSLEQLRANPRGSRIVVCVNMLGEGFDLPQLKVAAVHDTHKSLAILLQFTGRFTRSAGDDIGEATVIANIADQEVSSALERLYSEDADWNQLLNELSSEAARSHSELISFLNSSERLDDGDATEKVEISHHLLKPTLSTLIYEAPSFNPKKFFAGVPSGTKIQRVWVHQESNTLYFVTRIEPPIRWTRSRTIRDKIWDIYVLHYDESQNLLFLSSSDKSSTHEKIAKAVGGVKLIGGDVIFRSLGKINRLIFQNVGVRKHGRRNLRFAMYTGADVAEALSISDRAGAVKSNLSGTGWEDGQPVTIGCSYKGRVWARDPGTIPELVKWCQNIGRKIKDDSIDTAQIIANVLIPEEIDSLPGAKILALEWPIEIIRQTEDRVTLKRGTLEKTVSLFDLQLTSTDSVTNEILFRIVGDPEDEWANLALTIGGSEGFVVTRRSPDAIRIRVGKLELPVEEFFSNYPPMIRFMDGSELDGNLLIKPQHPQDLVFPDEQLEVWDWRGVDITKESTWKRSVQRLNSIQSRVANEFTQLEFDVVFDDDSPGEAADLICLKEEDEYLRLALIHCKYTKGATPGERVSDVVEVSSQAVRSAKWKWKFKDLCRHMLEREKRATSGRGTRFLKGTGLDMNRFVKLSRFKEVRPEIIIAQPGLSRANYTDDQKAVLAAAYNYLKETVGVDLDVICSD